ncbi:isopenicillin N synthase family dioxygenase [Chromobacterium piscinae]|uniref:2-oxoglutarate-dependent ethylene/succinate-forming enzyme n=1 Tax=Chromobacterium piscinae TaxID=686831 RepID=A0ABV0H6J0_9NEIS|nr:isopenicillin N synthase family oxygenase [Chromobacterium piscinae]MBX9296896.1 isopenicillin N synthase family oxygenase [Chromobacterium vaccinii]MBX9358426.1 isopenicillin N synthase family oxygenase [Chromobacterium vaccinii]MCD4502492.1 isopenicillin N synthase family oxygenase [Chromobacterium piscinae]NHQ84413.1 isopenicillin N synthase family oxygenase [Chromobacterium vaccinii]
MNVRVVDYRAPDAAEQFTRSLHETGFGVLTNHPIPQDLVEKIYAEWLEFFNSEEKFDYAFSVEKQDGWFSPEVSETAKGATLKDIKEYFHIYPWGRAPAQLKADADRYYGIANQLAQELLSWVQQYSPADIAANYREPLSHMIQDSQQTLLRVLRYPPLTGDEPAGSLRAAAHGDINLLTILPAANEPGLQVQGKNGEWLDVPCDFGTLVVNIGDMLQEASAGYYPSTQHRVVNPTGEGAKKSRISLPLFLHPRPDVTLSDRYTAGAYLDERLRELGVKM